MGVNMNGVARKIVNKLGYDVVKLRNSNAQLSTHLTNVFSSKKIDCVLDVGANSGQYQGCSTLSTRSGEVG